LFLESTRLAHDMLFCDRPSFRRRKLTDLLDIG
jgi:hypothetical protein